MIQSIALSLIGFAAAFAGVWVNWGIGWALLTGGLVLFVAGGLDARREGR